MSQEPELSCADRLLFCVSRRRRGFVCARRIRRNDSRVLEPSHADADEHTACSNRDSRDDREHQRRGLIAGRLILIAYDRHRICSIRAIAETLSVGEPANPAIRRASPIRNSPTSVCQAAA